MKIHIVRPGEQLWDLVQKYNVPLERVLEANPNIMEPEQLEVGSKVRIPSGRIPVSPLKREHIEEGTDLESFVPEKNFDPAQIPEFEFQPVVSRPETEKQSTSLEQFVSEDLQLILANPIPVKEIYFHEYETHHNDDHFEDNYHDDSSVIGLDEWESSAISSYPPSFASPFLPFYPTEPGFYPHVQLSHIPTAYPSAPPCTDCGSGYSPQVAMVAPPYPYWTPYGDPTFWQQDWYNQPQESAYIEWNEEYESSSAEF